MDNTVKKEITCLSDKCPINLILNFLQYLNNEYNAFMLFNI